RQARRLLAGGDLHTGSKLALEVAAVGAAGVALVRQMAVLNGATDRADPATGDHTDDVCAADDADEPFVVQHGDALEAVAGKNLGDLIHRRLLTDADDAVSHDVGNGGAFLADDIGLSDDTYHAMLTVHDGHTTDVVVCEDAGGILHGGIASDRDYFVGH